MSREAAGSCFVCPGITNRDRLYMGARTPRTPASSLKRTRKRAFPFLFFLSSTLSSGRVSSRSQFLSPPILSSASNMTTELPLMTCGCVFPLLATTWASAGPAAADGRGHRGEERRGGFANSCCDCRDNVKRHNRREQNRTKHTTIPSRTFSPPSFSSTASSRTIFRKTCRVPPPRGKTDLSVWFPRETD